MNCKIISWNVNSYNVRINHINDLINKHSPDIIFLQETRCMDIKRDDYRVFHNPASKGRNGVAIFTKISLEQVILPDFHDRCVVVKSSDNIFFISIYAPNGGSKSSPVSLRSKFFQFLIDTFKNKKVIIGGDFNVVYNEMDYETKLIYCEESVDSLKKFETIFTPAQHQYSKYITWYDYRDIYHRSGMGLDKFFLNINNKHNVKILTSYLHVSKRSDHIPITLTIDI